MVTLGDKKAIWGYHIGNMNKYFWQLHRNKIFAVTLSALGVISFVVAYVVFGLGFGFNFLTASPFTIINLVLNLVILTLLLINNIRNDNRAFGAVMMVVFLAVWGLIVSWLPGGSGLYAVFNAGPGIVTLGVFLLLFAAASIALGIVTYVFLFRYRLGRTSFERQMLFSRLFVACLVVELILEVVTIFSLIAFDAYTFTYYLLANLSMAFAGVACLFTLRRLR